MKKRYTFMPKNWLRFGLLSAFAASISTIAFAQNGPAKQWDKTFGGNSNSFNSFRSLQQTSDGGFILGGSSNSAIGNDKSHALKGLVDFWIIKLDGNGNKIWDKTYGGNSSDALISVKQTADGGYILGGSSFSDISGDKSQNSYAGSSDFWIVKLDSNGNKLWDKTYGGDGPDIMQALQQTADGGYILGGSSYSGIGGDKTQASQGAQDYWILKLDSSGNKLWDKTYGGYNDDQLSSLQQTVDGGFILGGTSTSYLSGDKSQPSVGEADYWIVKLDMNGNKQWDKTYGGTLPDQLFSLQQTSDGGFILAGTSGSGIGGDKSQNSQGYSDYWILKTDADGTKLWDKTIGGNLTDELVYIKQIPNTGYILGGSSASDISGDKSQASNSYWDYWIVQVDLTGNKIWDKTVGGVNTDRLFDMAPTNDGGFILGGTSDSGISGDKTQASKGSIDYWIVKIGGNPVGIKEPETNFNVSISPNPNQGKFTLQLSNLPAPKAEVIVSDLLGRVVLQQLLNVSNRQISEELTLPYAKGMYLLQVKIGEQLITRKIVVE